MTAKLSERVRTLRALVRDLLIVEAGADRSDEWYAGWADCWDKVHDAIERQPEGDLVYVPYARPAAEDQR